MTTPNDTSAGEQLLAAAGMTSTPEGRERAKARLQRARENFTEEKREQLRQAHLNAA
jgi:arginine/ornithine N-succinyltransferase beta subunit